MHSRKATLLLILPLFLRCASGDESADPWVDDRFVERADSIAIDADSAQAKPYQTTKKQLKAETTLKPTPKSDEVLQKHRSDVGALFDAYPPNPLTPPPMVQRQKVNDPDARKPPRYGTINRFEEVPQSAGAPFPDDYVGVARWNRAKAVSKGPLNPADSSFYYDIPEDDEKTISHTVWAPNKDVHSFQVGPQATFAVNFLDQLRGGSFTLGVNGLYVRNRLVTLEGWLGFRRISMGIGGENREVLTLNNFASGLSLGGLPYVHGDQHLRLMVGGEFDFNFSTTRELSGGAKETFSNIHSFGLTSTLGWHAVDWGVFLKYLAVLRQISADHGVPTHVIDVGLVVYLL